MMTDAADAKAQRGCDPNMILPEDVPVEMPELPRKLLITTDEQFKAIADPVRTRILRIIQNEPATAKQVADRLGSKPGTIGHHLQVLEVAGLAQVIARRQVRGTVAKYYTRTARLFDFRPPSDLIGNTSLRLQTLTDARDELLESLVAGGEDVEIESAFPHVRLAPERVRAFAARLRALIDELLNEESEASDPVYALAFSFFLAPPYIQPTARKDAPTEPPAESPAADE